MEWYKNNFDGTIAYARPSVQAGKIALFSAGNCIAVLSVACLNKYWTRIK